VKDESKSATAIKKTVQLNSGLSNGLKIRNNFPFWKNIPIYKQQLTTLLVYSWPEMNNCVHNASHLVLLATEQTSHIACYEYIAEYGLLFENICKHLH